MRWLRDFFRDRDPLVKIAAGLSEPEAQMWRELLENNGVPAFIKNMDFLSAYGASSGNAYDMWVKEADAERALDILRPMLPPGQLPDAASPRRRAPR
jgi:hypothetical protein